MTNTTQSTAMVNRLSELVHIESPSGDINGINAMIESLVATHRDLGGRIERVHADPTDHLVIRYGAPSDRSVLLVGHADTVWDLGTLTSTVPWVESENQVAGPGAFDMKSGLVIMETAIANLLASGKSIRPTTIVITSDEEIGSPTSTPLIRELSAHTNLALGFESPHPDGAFKVGRRGSTRVRIQVTGKEAHAALDPESGISAIDELVDQLIIVRGIIDDILKEFPGAVLCNVGSIKGGARANVVPGHAEAVIGLRFTSLTVEEATLARFTALSPIRNGAIVNAEVLTNRPTWQAHNVDEQALRQISALADAIGIHVDGRPAAGAADTNLLGSLSVPTIDGLGPRGGGAHAVSEHINVDSFVERAELLARILDADASLDM